MKDLYKSLNLESDASEEEIRRSLSLADPDARRSGEMVLLDPRRRVIYDRNRRLLLTIAQLRFELGLNYTRFWARREFKDFWQAPVFTPSNPQEAPKQRITKLMIAQAFHTVRHHSRRHAVRWGSWWVAGWIVIAAGSLTGICLWCLEH
jgi:hypothetical protein